MLRYLKAIFRRRPVVVSTYKRKETDLSRLRREKHQQLARELGLPVPEVFS